MSAHAGHFDDQDQWHPPETFRECLADTERVAVLLLDSLRGELLVPVADVEFLARRLYQLARTAHSSLPSEVG